MSAVIPPDQYSKSPNKSQLGKLSYQPKSKMAAMAEFLSPEEQINCDISACSRPILFIFYFLLSLHQDLKSISYNLLS